MMANKISTQVAVPILFENIKRSFFLFFLFFFFLLLRYYRYVEIKQRMKKPRLLFLRGRDLCWQTVRE